MKLKTIIGLATILYACGDGLPTPDAYTPRNNIPVATHGIGVNIEKIDSKYEGVIACLSYGKVNFMVEIMSSGTYFNCGDASPTGRCAGLYWDDLDLIQIPAKQDAFEHELTHHLTGSNKNTDERVIECGDGIDGLFTDE